LRKTLLFLGLGPILLVLMALTLWRLWPAAPPEVSRDFLLAGRHLRFQTSYLRATGLTEPDRIDLAVIAPDFTPAGVLQIIPPTGDAAAKSRAQIFVTLTPAEKNEKAASPAERYGPYLGSEAQVGDGGLLRRRFEENSPFAGEDLFLSPPDGEEFSARCPRPKIPADGLPDLCLATFRIEGISAQLRFDPVWLGQWSVLRANVLLLVRGALAG
jgi:hypothetical protein